MRKFQALPNTDGQYLAYSDDTFLGKIKKVYTGRSAHLWTIEPDAYEQRSTLRVGYGTRDRAYTALCTYTRTGNSIWVEG